jgi:hypothetical protein
LIVGELNAKHADWNSRLITARGSLLRDYANRNPCMICGPKFPTMAPNTHNKPPDILDKVVVKVFVLAVHLTVCPPLNSDHLTVLNDAIYKSSFQNLLYCPASREWTRLHSRLALMTDSRGIPFHTTRRQSARASS